MSRSGEKMLDGTGLKGFTVGNKWLLALAKRLPRERATWILVRYEGTRRGGYVDVQSWSSKDLDLFGMLALLVVFRNSTVGGMFVLSVYAPREVEVLRVRIRRA